MDQIEKWLVALAAGWFAPGAVLAQERFYEWRWQMHPAWWGMWGFGMMVLFLLFWVLVIVGLLIGIRWLIVQARGVRHDSAHQILRERYARGEINKDEFEAKKRDLG